MYLRQLIKRRQANPRLTIPYLPYSQKKKRKKKRPIHIWKKMPSIYIPHEMKTKDLSDMYYDSTELTTRQELEAEEKLKDQVNFYFNFI